MASGLTRHFREQKLGGFPMQAWRNRSVQWSGSAARHCLQGCVLMIALLLGAGLVFAQSEQSEVKQFQATAKETADALQDNVKPEKRAQLQRDSAVEFILGNTLFVVLHESGHTTISELGLPVLGRQEDAADAFAVVTLLKVGSVVSRRILVEAAKGWFLSDLRDKRDGEKLVFYDEHGLDEQRAYQIVCLMVGSDPVKYKDLADETKLPADRQESCKQDYADASTSWEEVLKPHRRATKRRRRLTSSMARAMALSTFTPGDLRGRGCSRWSPSTLRINWHCRPTSHLRCGVAASSTPPGSRRRASSLYATSWPTISPTFIAFTVRSCSSARTASRHAASAVCRAR
jgi:hypothetical protein